MLATKDGSARVIAGRYALSDVLDEGGSGVVRRARDLLLDAPVAVKSLLPGARAPEPRIRREIAALWLLRLPGVVTLRDDVREDGEIHLVMDLVEGTDFPGEGRASTWEAIGPLARSLLETLGHVHAAGVVHRDLKPGNVLVGDDGRVTVVDFGLSRGPALAGDSLTMTGAFVGTPQYMAPEQLGTAAIDGRTDLYAVGVMLYEALAGTLPIDGDNFGDLARRKLSGSFIPLAQAAPHVPRNVARAVNVLLSVHPEDRPRTAVDAIRRFFGEGSRIESDAALIWLGSREPLERALQATRRGVSIDICGAQSSGRTRLLREVAEELADDDISVSWVTLGRSPFASLSGVLGNLDDIADLSRDDAFATLDRRLHDSLAGGLVLLADDPDQIDQWSARALDRARDHGAILRVVEESTHECIRLGHVCAQDLEPLFIGSSRLLHLPEGAAEELWRRTGGDPSRVHSEISAWVLHGMVRREDGRVRIDRASLARLQGGRPLRASRSSDSWGAGVLRSEGLRELLAWIALAWPYSTDELLARVVDRAAWMLEPEVELLIAEGLVQRLDDGRLQPLALPDVPQIWPDETRRSAHLALARAVPENAPERVRHLVAAGATDEVITAALSVGSALAADGRTSEACATIEQGLDVAREANAGAAYAALLCGYTDACMSEGTPSATNEALYELDRARRSSSGLSQLRDFLLAVLERQRGEPSRALQLLDDCGPLDDEILKLWRQCQRMAAAESLDVATHEQVLKEIGAWAQASANQRALDNHRTWSATLVGRREGPEAAVALHLEADCDGERATVRMAALLNVGTVLLSACRFEETEDVARRVVQLAQACRHPVYEGYAESLLRDARYRRGDWTGADLELVDAAAEIGSPQLEAMIATTECAFAWRADRLDDARALATRAAVLWGAIGARPMHLVARAMEMVCGDAVDAIELARLLDEVAAADHPELAVQFAGLLAPHAGPLARRAAEIVRSAADATPETTHDTMLDTISVTEALERVAAL